MGQTAVVEQSRRLQMRAAGMQAGGTDRARSGSATPSSQAGRGSPPALGEALPEEHPLGRSVAKMGNGHWVPTIPGYGGYIPAKHAENICGGGIIHTCKMAGRAIAERNPLHEQHPPVTLQDDMKRSRVKEFYHAWNRPDGSEPRPEHVQLASDVREHCSTKIPGYMGHVP